MDVEVNGEMRRLLTGEWRTYFFTNSFLLFSNDSLLLKCSNLFVTFVEMKVYC